MYVEIEGTSIFPSISTTTTPIKLDVKEEIHFVIEFLNRIQHIPLSPPSNDAL